mmetsp:Transcript_3753/g.5910  ORF Transcript_3753/g.5910 Transcript_3753/m.5910 type:complete len:307 (+) Transcript_3753:66-986(+)|eukprot:CAMPEP_0178752020 /NCGR_PEP_ID=MMETSP0744-20121128/10837_1 /TAXON_ID=913974 /ORGANISM="Nitzschia punctata, Strain CCMP561" /LENGTH=306 /DNA_ID=CAMNT_0020405705 /DNA_START=190 /DNA_END=1110 /DNA_ORIENTATION=-
MTTEEQPQMVERRQTTTMSDFFRSADVDKATQDLLLKYDEDGNGVFSKAEVTAIIHDLQEQFRQNEELVLSNKMLKRLLIGAVIFFILLVASIFGLSFAVASLTKDMSVNTATGTLYTKDGSAVVATDSRAELYQVESFDFGGCISLAEAETMRKQVVEGKNVLVEQVADDGSQKLSFLSASGATFNATTGVSCFPVPGDSSGTRYCVGPDPNCESPEARRRMNARRNLGVCDNNPNHPNCVTEADPIIGICVCGVDAGCGLCEPDTCWMECVCKGNNIVLGSNDCGATEGYTLGNGEKCCGDCCY